MLSRLQVLHALTNQMRHVLPDERITRVRGLALLVLGVVWSGQVGLPGVAAVLPVPARLASTERRLRRWVANTQVDVDRLWRPQRRRLLEQYRGQEITLVFDPTPFRSTATLLCVGIVHGRRVLPLDVQVMPQQEPWDTTLPAILGPMFTHLAADLPAECTVTLLADRGFVGPGLVDCCTAVGWNMVQRLRSNPQESTRIQLPDGSVTTIPTLVTKPGQGWSSAVKIFKDAGWRTGFLTIVWQRAYAEPWVLFSTRDGGRARVREYRRRTRVEATYQDWKSRGFQLERSRVRDHERVRRLLLIVFLAFWWLVSLGDRAVKHGFRPRWERASRPAMSRLTLGYRYLNDCLDHHRLPPLLFPRPHPTPPPRLEQQSVRK
jgi:hypothetical protein